MALTASGIGLDPTLKNQISPYGTNAYNTINSNFTNALQGIGKDATARGMNGAAATSPNSYAGQQFAAKQPIAVGGLESALGGGLANTSYQNELQNREFLQNEQLAEEAAHYNKPSQLEQILGGIGAVGGTAAGIYGAWGKNRAPAPNYGYSAPSGAGSAYNIQQPGPLDLGVNWGQ